MALTMSKHALHTQGGSIRKNQIAILDKIAEVFWFFLSLSLFVILGPFSAPIALIVLLQLGFEERDQELPNPVR